ncbi:MAG: glycine/betaine ABC transporter substrate-binding protein [Chloroflexi bacterium]|nr:glycine/betaine ABC transporter substrate-binding protein [Chloroflexota bacterium]
MFKKSRVIVFVLFVTAVTLLAACGGGGDKPTITLIENSWPASEINIAVAANLLENEMGFPVEVVSIDESAQWDALAAGDADASLEVWPSGHGERIAQYIDEQDVVEDGGPLGPIGLIAWYVPTYAVDANPALATWEGYTNADTAAQFASAETGDNGTFYAGPAGWTQYDQQIIDNLGMSFEVINAASEDALLAQVSAAYEREEPILFYFYEPHVLFTRLDLTMVELPEYSDDCYAQIDAGGVDCAYPGDELMKILSADLAEKSPDAHQFLKNFNYTTADQTIMLGYLDQDMTVQEAAQKWIDDNESVWSAWLP